MTSENNEKYIARSWIDDGTQEGFKKSFLESLLNQWQGEGNGFNADKLDGKHYCEIINEIDGKVENLIPAFRIGNVHINKETIENHDSILKIGFEGVQLNVIGEDGYLRLPWDDESVVREGTPDLYGAFDELYQKVQKKVNTTDFENYQHKTDKDIENLLDFQETLDKNIDYDEDGKLVGLNATTINGLRIYVKTKEEYNNLDEAVKKNPRNLFIINEEGELSDEVLAMQPDTQPISSYYEFRISEPRPGTDAEGNPGYYTYLQYKHETQPDEDKYWHDICRTEDFLDENAIDAQVIRALAENSTYTLNQDSFNRSLKNVPVSDTSDYELANYIRWSGIRDLTCTKYNISIPTTPSKDDSNNYGTPRTADLSNLVTKIEEVVDSKITEKMQQRLDQIYPKGYIYITTDPRNPKNVLGFGTWERIEGRFLVGSGNVTDQNNETKIFSAEEERGELNHKLTEAEIPSHKHSHNHVHNASKDGYLWTDAKNDIRVGAYKRKLTEKSKDGLYYVYGFTKPNTVRIHQIPVGVGDVKDNGYTNHWTGSTGSSQAHNNLPPYFGVNIWRRTA